MCLYCSSDYPTGSCPICAQNRTSNLISEQTRSLEKIGYQTQSAIEASNHELSNSLSTMSSEIRQSIGDVGNVIGNLERTLIINHYEMMQKKEEEISLLTSIYEGMTESFKLQYRQRLSEGINSLKDGRLDNCIKVLEKAEELKSDDPLVYIYKGHAYARMDDLDNALKNFEEACSITVPDYNADKLSKSYCLFLISRVHFCKGNIDTATKKIEQSIALNKNCPEYHYQYATCLAQKMPKLIKGSDSNSR